MTPKLDLLKKIDARIEAASRLSDEAENAFFTTGNKNEWKRNVYYHNVATQQEQTYRRIAATLRDNAPDFVD